MDNCIFCKIVRKEIPCDKVYEDENFLAFLDIEPVRDGHLLIIPKEHIVWMQDASDEVIAGIFQLAKKLMIVLKAALSPEYVSVSVAGKDVPHFHVHLIPRSIDDGFKGWPTKKYKDGEVGSLIEKITKNITENIN